MAAVDSVAQEWEYFCKSGLAAPDDKNRSSLIEICINSHMTLQESSSSSISSCMCSPIGASSSSSSSSSARWGRRQRWATVRPVCRSFSLPLGPVEQQQHLSSNLSLHAAARREQLSQWLRHARLRFSCWICLGCTRWVFPLAYLFCRWTRSRGVSQAEYRTIMLRQSWLKELDIIKPQ